MALTSEPILLVGGTGAIGRLTARALRSAYSDVPLLIGGRDLAKAREAAEEINQAEGVKIDALADDLGLGKDRQGSPLRARHAVLHPGGAAPLTALGVSMILERLAGLDGGAPTQPGLYFPFQVLDRAAYLARLKAAGGSLLTLEPE